MARFRLTPLNLIAALGLGALIISYTGNKQELLFLGTAIGAIYKMLFFALVLVAMITDLIFRFLFKDLKRIWLVELIFITLTTVIFLLLQN